MPDVSLPPVGELVQITETSGRQVFAYWDGRFFSATHPETGSYSTGRPYIASWCGVLVLPDTEETARVVESVIREHVFGPDFPADESECCAAAVLAAVRGAAIR